MRPGGNLLIVDSSVSLVDCVVQDGQAEIGGGIGVELAYLEMVGCTIRNNMATDNSEPVFAGAGGGLQAFLAYVEASECTFTGNIAVDDVDRTGGGGAMVLALAFCGLDNCLVSNNSAGIDGAGGIGGGILELFNIALVMDECTVTGNTARTGMIEQQEEAGPTVAGGGIAVLASMVTALRDCLVSENTVASDGELAVGGGLAFLNMYVGDLPEYVDGPPEGCDDVVDVDPGLLPLADNGGPTLTHALTDASPALDGTCDCTVTETFTLSQEPEFPPYDPGCWGKVMERDQRGEPRPIDGDADGEVACDSGEFEAQPDIVLDGGTGDSVAARDTSSGDCSVVYVTISNDGHAPLLVESVRLEGSGSGDYSLVRNPAGTVIGAGDSMRLALNFCPGSPGPKQVTVKVYSSDPDEPVAEVDIVGQAGSGKDSVDPARTSTSYLNIDPMQVVPGQQVMVTANVCNNGGERGSHTASLAVNGTAEQSQSVTVSPDACKQVVFVVTRAVPGTYDVSVDGMQGQFTVVSPRLVQASVPASQSNGLGTAGLLAMGAVLVVLVVGLIVVFRQQ